jgi:hypothetical protein
MDVLIHISQQLSNSTTPAFVPTVFQVSSNAAVVNTLFFLSLALVLIDAFLAMLVKGWLQEFDRGWRKYTIAHLRAQERERRLHELERWRLHELVALLPILIQGSLLLFCIGLIVLIFPLHLPSAIMCSFAFVSVVGFYGFITYVSIVNDYAPFSSPVSRLLAHGPAITQAYTRRITSAIRFHIRRHLRPQEQRLDPDTMYPLPSNNKFAKPMQPNMPDSTEKGKVVPRSRSDIDPQTHIHVLERLVSTTAEAVENIPIFLELLDQPVKHFTLQPSNAEKWKELLDTTLGLLRDQSTLPVSAAWTLARIMMVCYNRQTADRRFCLTLQHHLGSRELDVQRTRMPLHLLFSSYLRFWLDYSYGHALWRTIAFLEPSDAADAELFWMVNTFHRAMQFEIQVDDYREFFVAVLTYIASTEQSRRSKVPLTAAVIYAMHTVRSTLDQGSVDSIDGLCILPGTFPTSEFVPMMFRPVAGVDALDLWNEDYTRFAKDLLQWDWGSYSHHGFQVSLIAALYIDSTKQAQSRATFANLLKCTRITHIQSPNSDAYDHGKLAVYWYMALTQKPLDHGQDCDPIDTLYGVIESIITEHSTFQLPGLHVLEIAVRHLNKMAPSSSTWLERVSFGLATIAPDERCHPLSSGVDHWALLHLETLLAPQRFLLPEEVKELTWSDTPEKVYIAKARLDLYRSLAKAEPEGSKAVKPDPDLLRLFLWSKNYEVCTQAFKWCLQPAPFSQPGPPGDGDSARVFILETMGCEWVEHFVHVLCRVDSPKSWWFLEFYLIPKWTTLPSSWCSSFASAFLFSTVQPQGMHGLPAYQCLANSIGYGRIHQLKFLPFLVTMLQPIESSLTFGRITVLENWLANIPEGFGDQDARAHLEHILATRKQRPLEEALSFFAELPMADSWMYG